MLGFERVLKLSNAEVDGLVFGLSGIIVSTSLRARKTRGLTAIIRINSIGVTIPIAFPAVCCPWWQLGRGRDSWPEEFIFDH